ncbi:PREDICTED: uncharacterized protein LOC109382939 [Hipposideros armiger]|uniref:Uncharacterized protein LOC109382939 n=1 Tax=Hipposideros armiger TaxID=186990 RepID=A0A8B7RFW2_HIPAR|nr:PREDICTED: uncharacterized protein LOC109382939 [Hipposideros armiger]
MQEGGRAVSEESEPPPPPPSASRLNPALPLLLVLLSLPPPPPLRTRGPCTPRPTWALTFLLLWPGLPQAARSAPCPYATAARPAAVSVPPGAEAAGRGGDRGWRGPGPRAGGKGSPDPSPHIKRYNVSFYGEAAPYMVSPCVPAPLVRCSGNSAPYWATGGAYLHRHTELVAVIPRQTATPKGEEPTPLKGTGEEATTLSHQAGSPVLIHHPLYWEGLWQTYIWKRPERQSASPSQLGEGRRWRLVKTSSCGLGWGRGWFQG